MSETVTAIIFLFVVILGVGGFIFCLWYMDKMEKRRDAEKECQRALLCSSLDKHSTALLRLGASVDAFNKLCEGGDKND